MFLVWKKQNPWLTPSVKRTPTTESLVELEGERRAMYRTVVGKTVVHVPGTSRRHVQREGNIKKDHVSNREWRDESEAYCEILEWRSECKEPDRNHCTFEVCERVFRQRLGRTSNNVQEHKWRSCAVVKCNTHSMVTNTANSKFEFCWSRMPWRLVLPKEWWRNIFCKNWVMK